MNLKIYRKISLSRFCTFNIGGFANFFCLPDNVEQLFEAVEFSKKNGLKPIFFGSGANILFPDIVNQDLFFISLRNLLDINIYENSISVSSGFPVSLLPFLGFKDLFFLYLLPGTTGAATYMNVRYDSFDIGPFIDKIIYLDLLDMNIKEIKGKDANFSYKNSIFQKNNWIILETHFNRNNSIENDFKKKSLDKKFIIDQKNNKLLRNLANKLSIYESDLKNFYKILRFNKVEKIINKRINEKKVDIKKIEDYRLSKYHFTYPSCGSIFKNNYNFGVPTGALVDNLKLKGYRHNDAQIAPYHGNIIINLGRAKADDVKYLINMIQEQINNAYGFIPEPEIVIL